MSLTIRSNSDPIDSPVLISDGDPVVANLTRLLSVGVLALVSVTWKLWTPQTSFPQVPLLRVVRDCPGWVDWICLSMLLAASAILLIVGRRGRASRLACAVIATVLAGFFVLNQHRLQPWAWQFFLLSALLALADDVTTRRGWMWLTISIYFWSAISKFDFTFFHEQGPVLIEALKHAVGIHQAPTRWTTSFDVWAATTLALGELSVAILLIPCRTRRFGVWLALVMHGALLVALGPLGLKHSLGVLVWNLFFAVQTWLLFQPQTFSKVQCEAGSPPARPTGSVNRLRNGLATGLILVAVILPVLEPVGGCDTWLAWAVYSARAGQSEILCETDEPVPTTRVEFDSVVRTIDGQGAVFSRARIAAWSLSELGVPVYPQYRFHVAVGRYLQQELPLQQLVVTNQKYSRWNGRPSELQVIDLQFRADGNSDGRFFWNTQPRWIHGD